ncbi:MULTISPECIES: HisA/HisF family protein [Methanobrevibacter]|uniref:Phosphoribosylformimino-5-aminoimidazole carboxamide ribotide isomerase n=1 Tax=Methanobrevibacter gottschalkii DSM 11977 TaxID=1122229 RepID=A0A3N5B3E5_9EURY|nr:MULTISPECIES: HisA/HisF family protein [Methanobrevibacter]OEC95217.1 phosphoribosylformimino-5-aminoimidazole carboxamide ribotide isomerase [Methanobrevibacter sp. A27]RPF51823.1 phosphoribosylformimino-5-aminoimidazole carboxamide ribotide isomerase [Methanobrevibacter gottschalkii DSM 11977]
MIKKIPVIDLKQHQAVSGKSGMRDKYQPLKTVFAKSANPVEIAQGLKLNGATEMYIADLDLIESVGHNINDIKMVNTILPVIFDGGVKNCEGFEFFLNYAYKIIIPTETLESIDEMRKIFEKYPKERIVISVDVKNGELLAKHLNLNLSEFKEILKELDPNDIIILDISSVGTERGYNKKLLEEFGDLKEKLIIGGGLNKDSLVELESLGIKKVLIGTSLHSGEVKLLD